MEELYSLGRLVHYFGYHGRRRTFVIKLLSAAAAAAVRMPPSVRHHGGLSLRYKANRTMKIGGGSAAAVSSHFH